MTDEDSFDAVAVLKWLIAWHGGEGDPDDIEDIVEAAKVVLDDLNRTA